jgi:uncharacterized coiled-coil DUF342 family protein
MRSSEAEMKDDIETLRTFVDDYCSHDDGGKVQAALACLQAKVAELEKERDAANFKTRELEDHIEKFVFDRQSFLDRAKTAEAERDSLRAKLERATGKINECAQFLKRYQRSNVNWYNDRPTYDFIKDNLEPFLAELSADAPAQQTQIVQEWNTAERRSE